VEENNFQLNAANTYRNGAITDSKHTVSIAVCYLMYKVRQKTDAKTVCSTDI